MASSARGEQLNANTNVYVLLDAVWENYGPFMNTIRLCDCIQFWENNHLIYLILSHCLETDWYSCTLNWVYGTFYIKNGFLSVKNKDVNTLYQLKNALINLIITH